MHLVLILFAESKLKDASDIDSLISAEITDPQKQPQLCTVVKVTMVHGPCGILNKKSVCMSDNKCTKEYPKEFRETTTLAQDG